MSLLLALVAWILALLGGVLLLLIVVPIHLRASGELCLEPWTGEAQLEARWAWGLLAFRLGYPEGAGLFMFGRRVKRIEPPSEEEKQKKKAQKKEKKEQQQQKKKGKKRGLGWFLRHRRTMFRAAGRLLRTLGPEARIRGTVGLGDPADTAVLLQAVWLADRVVPGLVLELQPDYVEDVLELQGRARLRVWLLYTLAVAVALLFRRDTWAMLRAPT
jgi:hypothetical protein